MTPTGRSVERKRRTNETDVSVVLDLDQTAPPASSTGLPFFDHMVSQLGKHTAWTLTVEATGDVQVDAHHTVEDVGIVLGSALADALGDKAGIWRFASISLPLDEALVDVALDISGRPFLRYEVEFAGDAVPLGEPGFEPQLAEEFWRAFVTSAGITLHITLRYGRNTHHILEACFKGVARALRVAVARTASGEVPSTKGSLGPGS
ncbi:MAG TPA: imidazoleglycerol-phosphate dehydratase HisB [Acidimicrobiales bacterium]|nr:imidazoleglycerol-phosphate dehydratase HisB [Acidimicrobiales bacterium]